MDNYLSHPFMRQADAPPAASSPSVSGQMPDKAANAEASSSSLASIGQRATSPVPASTARRPTPPPTATAQVVPAAPQMMDLLSLEDSAASPATAPAQPAVDNSDGEVYPVCGKQCLHCCTYMFHACPPIPFDGLVHVTMVVLLGR